MSHDDYWDDFVSRADRTANFISFGNIGGIGQLVYHNFRFLDYTLEFDDKSHMERM